LEQGEPKQLAPSHFSDANITGSGREGGAASPSTFLFEMLRSHKGPWVGGEIILSRKGKF
jgi:hypothetical protein